MVDTAVNSRIKDYLATFKKDIHDKIVELGLTKSQEETNQLLEYMYEYDRLTFNKEDLTQKKRVKKNIPIVHRCVAKRANGEQCTRKRRADSEFCGTHFKGTPHGLVTTEESELSASADASAAAGFSGQEVIKMGVFAEEICGIVYYLDKFGNVYNTRHILENQINPAVIAKWKRTEDGRYTIPEFNI